jgi:hypothetical protein
MIIRIDEDRAQTIASDAIFNRASVWSDQKCATLGKDDASGYEIRSQLASAVVFALKAASRKKRAKNSN